MTCDRCNQEKELLYVVVTTRPSDPTELVSILAFCEECGFEQNPIEDYDEFVKLLGGPEPHVLASREFFYTYIDSGTAATRKHIWLTI